MTSRMPRSLLGVLGLLAMTSPIVSDLYLPVFTDIEQDLNVSASSVQLTLTGFLLGLGIGQLFLGPLSDTYGRRRVLLTGLSIFVAASFVMIASPNIEVFILLRIVQGLAGAAGIVLARAIVADLTRGAETVRTLSLVAMLVGLGPIIAPPIGGLTNLFTNWRGVLAVVAIIALAMLVLSWLLIPESLEHKYRHAAGIKTVAINFGGLLSNLKFFLPLLAFGACYGSMSAYIAASPFVGQVVLGMSPFFYSIAFAISAVALLTANFINARLAGRRDPRSMLLFGAILSVVSSALMLTSIVFGFFTVPVMVALAFFLTAGTGFVLSNASAIGLMVAHKARGSGSALLGSTQYFFGALASPLVGLAGSASAMPMGIVMLASSVLTFGGAFGAWITGRRPA